MTTRPKIDDITGGKWSFLKSLSGGGQALTFLVHESKTEVPRTFVLKLLKNTGRKSKSRFKRELEAGLSLSHENIVKIIDSDIDQDHPYLVMEYCTGGSLTDYQKEIKDLSLVRQLKLFLSICNGVGHAHQHDPPIIHRDIKPKNIFLRMPEQIPVIGDFGLCFKVDGERITWLDEQVGSRYYMAPEMADGKAEDVGPQCDVYSLGKVLYWLVSNGRIFDREKHRDSKYDLSKESQDPTYAMINELLDKMVVEDPLSRLRDAAIVGQRVEKLIERIDSIQGYYHLDIEGWQRQCVLSINPSETAGQLPTTDMPGKWKAQLGPEKIEGFGPELGEDKNWSRFQKCVGNQRTISLYNPEIPFRSFDNFLEFNLDGLLPFREIHYFVFCIAELDNVGTRFSAYIRLDYRGSIRWLCFSPAPELKSYKDFTNPQQHRETIFPARLNVGDKKLNVINLSDVKETLRQAWATDSVNVDDCYVSGLRFRGAFSLSFAGLAR